MTTINDPWIKPWVTSTDILTTTTNNPYVTTTDNTGNIWINEGTTVGTDHGLTVGPWTTITGVDIDTNIIRPVEDDKLEIVNAIVSSPIGTIVDVKLLKVYDTADGPGVTLEMRDGQSANFASDFFIPFGFCWVKDACYRFEVVGESGKANRLEYVKTLEKKK